MKDIKRVILKLSGEALAAKEGGYNDALIENIAGQVKQVIDKGIDVGVVIGGGNYWRGRSNNNIDRPKADQIGMLATIMNCIYVSEIFRSCGLKTNILTPFECGSMTKLFSKDRANKYFEKGMVVFFAGGTGHPFFSTDTGIALRAIELDAYEKHLSRINPYQRLTAPFLSFLEQPGMLPRLYLLNMYWISYIK